MTQDSGIRHGNLVAGAAAAGQGILSGWRGQGPRTHAQLSDIAVIAGIPREWLPQPKDASIQLGRAMQHVAGTVYLAKPTRKSSALRAARESDPSATISWASQWQLIAKQEGAKPGDPYGMVVLVATVYEDDGEPRIEYTPYGYLSERVAEQYDARIASSEYTAADVTKWLGDTLYRRLNSVRYGGNWYVPRGSKESAEALLNAVRESGWGKAWVYPPLPIATTGELQRGLAISFTNEVADLANAIELTRAEARKSGRVDIGERAVESWQGKVRSVETRAREYLAQLLLTDEGFKDVQEVVYDMMTTLDGILDVLGAQMAA